jgi:hypothetical protein
MPVDRWVYCRFCEQSYLAGPGERCSLCRQAGGLREVAPTRLVQTYRERASRAPPGGSDAGTTLAAGCFGMLVGGAFGAAIALSLPVEGPPGGECGMWVVPLMFGQLFVGLGVGAVVGGLGGLLLLGLLTRLGGRPPVGPRP